MRTIEDNGLRVKRLPAIGGGAISDVWRQIIADALNRPISRTSQTLESCAVGAALTAAVGAKLLLPTYLKTYQHVIGSNLEGSGVSS
ncbi:MAG TPA: FGGY-family carbohydrate kinase [Candidatus Bathyarchaeia archaeon]|nr:FGGY-family carbohydrate kinase [Candidatus Bathyarchaeia archaeon]